MEYGPREAVYWSLLVNDKKANQNSELPLGLQIIFGIILVVCVVAGIWFIVAF